MNLKADTTGTDTFKGQQKKMSMAAPTYNAANGQEFGDAANESSDSDVSEAGGNVHQTESGMNQGGNVQIDELIIELRHKYITILKSLYWEHFEEGQCQAGSVTVLIESADRALDHENVPL